VTRPDGPDWRETAPPVVVGIVSRILAACPKGYAWRGAECVGMMWLSLDGAELVVWDDGSILDENEYDEIDEATAIARVRRSTGLEDAPFVDVTAGR
jgi:hypothetical protein